MYSFYDYFRGDTDFQAGIGPTECPYTTEHEHLAWTKGWYDAYIRQIHSEYAGASRFIEIKRNQPYKWAYQ